MNGHESLAENERAAGKTVSVSPLDNHPIIGRIHDDALRILEEVGVRCISPEVRQIFEDTGLAAYDETTGHIYLLRPLVEQALATVPKRDAFWVPENSFGVGGTAPFVYDDTTGELIKPTLEHVAHIARIAEASDVVGFIARGVLIVKKEVEVMETLIANTRKQIYVAALSEAGIAKAKEIHNSRGNIVVQFSIINSPLNVMESMIPAFLSCVKQGIPVYISTMPMAGLSAPYSMSSLVTLTHAEALFGLTLAQIVSPGVTVVHAGLPSITNLEKNYALDIGSIAHNAANILMGKVTQRLDIPSIHSGCTTGQEKPGPRAEQDAINGYALFKLHGFHQIRHAFGFLKDLVSFSIAKLERHIQLCEETTPDMAPKWDFDNYDEAGFDVIARNGSNPNYMRDAHTLANVGKEFKY